MRNFKFLTPLLLSAVLFSAPTYAQRVWAPDTDATPFRPTSAELVRVSVPARGCSELRIGRNVGFRLRMVESHITLTLEESPGLWGSAPDGTFINACFPSPTGRDTFELGRLPAGDYALTIIDAVSVTQPAKAILTNKAFSVTDARTTKAAPWVRLDYSGHWWDPNDSGWGLFIWHSENDQVLAAWFTYGLDGKPIWYVAPNCAIVDAVCRQSVAISVRCGPCCGPGDIKA